MRTPALTTSRSGYRRSPQARRLSVAILYIVVVGLVSLHLSELVDGRTFFYDEWSFVVNRNEWSWQSLLTAHNGHPSVIPAAIYISLLQIFGLGNFSVFLAVGLAVHLVVCALASAIVHRHLGLFPGLSSLVAFGLLGTGWQNSLWPFQIGFMGSVAGFLASVLLLGVAPERREGGTWRLLQLGASLSLLYSVMSSGVGVAAVAGVAIWLLLGRRVFAGAWWVPVPAIAVYAGWYALYGGGGGSGFSLSAVPRYVAESASFAAAGTFDLDVFWGALLFGLVLGVLSIRFGRGELPLSSALAPVACFLAVFWGLTAVSRGVLGEPGASRYVYVGSILGVLGISSLLANSRFNKLSFALLALLSAITTSSTLSAGAGGLRFDSDIMRTLLAWVDIHAEGMPQDLVIDEVHSPHLTVGGYRTAAAEVGGSPASGVNLENVGSPLGERLDLLVSRSWIVQILPVEEMCDLGGSPDRLQLVSGSSRLVTTRSDSSIEIRRFAPDAPSQAPIPLPPGSYRISSPPDAWPQPYSIVLSSPENTSVCG